MSKREKHKDRHAPGSYCVGPVHMVKVDLLGKQACYARSAEEGNVESISRARDTGLTSPSFFLFPKPHL